MNFSSLTEAKESILNGGEIIFSYNEKEYGILRNSNEFILAKTDGSDEVMFISLEALLDYQLGDSRIRDILKNTEILYKNL